MSYNPSEHRRTPPAGRLPAPMFSNPADANNAPVSQGPSDLSYFGSPAEAAAYLSQISRSYPMRNPQMYGHGAVDPNYRLEQNVAAYGDQHAGMSSEQGRVYTQAEQENYAAAQASAAARLQTAHAQRSQNFEFPSLNLQSPWDVKSELAPSISLNQEFLRLPTTPYGEDGKFSSNFDRLSNNPSPSAHRYPFMDIRTPMSNFYGNLTPSGYFGTAMTPSYYGDENNYVSASTFGQYPAPARTSEVNYNATILSDYNNRTFGSEGGNDALNNTLYNARESWGLSKPGPENRPPSPQQGRESSGYRQSIAEVAGVPQRPSATSGGQYPGMYAGGVADRLIESEKQGKNFNKGNNEQQLRNIIQKHETMIYRCAKEKNWQRAVKKLKEMANETGQAPTVRAYTSAISACSRVGQTDTALELLKEMKSIRVQPNVMTYSAAISACEKGRKQRQAADLLAEMKEDSIKPDVIAYNAVISACEKARKWKQAIEILREMQRDNVKPDVITYSATISACEKGGKLEKALELLKELKDTGMKPDLILYNAVISACDKKGDWVKAKTILEEMQTNQVKPDAISYSTAISACDRGKNSDLACELLQEMKEKNIQPNTLALQATQRALENEGRLDKAREILGLEQFNLTEIPKIKEVKNSI